MFHFVLHSSLIELSIVSFAVTDGARFFTSFSTIGILYNKKVDILHPCNTPEQNIISFDAL